MTDSTMSNDNKSEYPTSALKTKDRYERSHAPKSCIL